MIFKYFPHSPRDIEASIVLLVYMPILGAIGLIARSDLIVGISIAVALLYGTMFVLQNSRLLAIPLIWVPRKMLGDHTAINQYGGRDWVIYDLPITLLFYMPILGIVGIGIMMLSGNATMASWIGSSITVFSWLGSLVFGISMMLRLPRYFMYLHTKGIPHTISSWIGKYKARRQRRNELPAKRTPI